MKISTKRRSYLSFKNIGPYREIVLVGKNTLVVDPLSEVEINNFGRPFSPMTQLAYNSSMIIHEEKHYGNKNRGIDIGNIRFDCDDKKYHPQLPIPQPGRPSVRENDSRIDTRRNKKSERYGFAKLLSMFIPCKYGIAKKGAN